MSALVLTLMYLVYKWILSGENHHGYNRAVLLGIYSISFAAPPFIPTLSHMLDRGPDEHGTVAVGMPTVEFGTVDSAAPSVLATVLTVVYFSGVCAVVVATCYSALRLNNIIRKGERYDRDGFTLVVHDDNSLAPFSWRNYIVMNRKDFAESGDLILAHETKHVNARHWVDLMVAQAVAAFQWYNPAAWLMREELKTVHEYQADEAVILSGTDMKQYQMLLIKKAVGGRFQSLANSLNHSKLKKRITMMYNPKTSASRRLRVLALAPAFAAAVLVTDIPAVAGAIDSASGASLSAVMPAEAVAAVTESKVTKNTSAGQPGLSGMQDAAVAPASDKKVRTKNLEEIVVVGYGTAKKTSTPEAGRVNGNACDGEEMGFDVVDEAPEYPGGQVELMKFIAKNIRYPHDAMKDSIEGNVVVRFIVGNDGKVSSPEIVRGVCPSIDAEALRVVSSLPALKPARMKGKPVELWYNLPIAFRLTGNDRKKLIASIGTNSSRGMVAVELTGDEKDVTFIVDGVRVESIRDIDQSTIERVNVWKDETSPLYVKYKTPIVEIILKK